MSEKKQYAGTKEKAELRGRKVELEFNLEYKQTELNGLLEQQRGMIERIAKATGELEDAKHKLTVARESKANKFTQKRLSGDVEVITESIDRMLLGEAELRQKIQECEDKITQLNSEIAETKHNLDLGGAEAREKTTAPLAKEEKSISRGRKVGLEFNLEYKQTELNGLLEEHRRIIERIAEATGKLEDAEHKLTVAIESKANKFAQKRLSGEVEARKSLVDSMLPDEAILRQKIQECEDKITQLNSEISEINVN